MLYLYIVYLVICVFSTPTQRHIQYGSNSEKRHKVRRHAYFYLQRWTVILLLRRKIISSLIRWQYLASTTVKYVIPSLSLSLQRHTLYLIISTFSTIYQLDTSRLDTTTYYTSCLDAQTISHIKHIKLYIPSFPLALDKGQEMHTVGLA